MQAGATQLLADHRVCPTPNDTTMTLKVFITGASSGIGAALARHYAAAGATVALTARRIEVLETLRLELGATAHAFAADVTDAASLTRAAGAFMERHGVPDVVIACAGVSIGIDSALREDVPVFKQVMDTNVLGTLVTFQPFIDAMKKQRRGALVGIASVAGIRGIPGSGAYSASKAAVIAFTHQLAIQNAQYGVRANCILPGLMNTPMAVDTRAREWNLPREQVAAERDAKVPLRGKQGTAWDVANAALFLASDEANFITGISMLVDGGRVLDAG